ncbi:MAG: SMC family ATPase, partial [Cyanobacteria bacterium Co-bin13]|nr:SMC family ATPase [Cyanobacteria bacterium Co-bin13]
MQILSVTLKNFKTHRDRYFEFQPGTNAICGENGAGKTSLLEAIAWTLFNYQGDYAKEDLIRNGSSSAQATVAFISSRDGRTYEVQRCTQRGYTLYDPQLNERLPYTRIKDEVLPWLRQHLGVGPGTDLAQLFSRTIGVPQGTFTADFLQTAENRKAVFDAILKVEEYKAAYKQMNSLRRYAEDQVEAVKQEIAQYEEALQALPDLQTRQQAVVQEIQANQAELQALELALVDLQQQRSSLQAEAQQLQALSAQLQTLSSQIEGKTQVSLRLQQSLEQAKQAMAICEANWAAYEQYQAAEAQLQALSQQQQARQALQTQLRTVQKQAEQKQAALTRLQVKLESLDQTAQELTRLQPLAQQQAQIEQQLSQVQLQLQALHPIHLQLQQLQRESRQSQQQAVTLETALDRLQRLKPLVEEIVEREQQCDRIQQQLSRLEAARQFEQELQSLVNSSQANIGQYKTRAEEALQTLSGLQISIPLLSAEAVAALRTAIESGVALNHTLLGELEGILQDLASQTDASALRQQLQNHRKALEQRYQYRGELAQIPAQQQQLAGLKAQQQEWQTEQQVLQTRLLTEAGLEEEQRALSQSLAALGNPQGQCQLLEKSLQDRSRLQALYDQQSADQQTWQQQVADLETQLEAFANLDLQVAQQQAAKQAHWTGHSLYLQNQQAAGQQPQLEAELTATEQATQSLKQQQSQLQQDYIAQQAKVDPVALAAIERQYGEMRSQADRLSGSLPQQQKLLAELEQQLTVLQEMAQKRGRAEQERLRRDRVKRFVNFARNAYKEAGPRISECYVQNISREADRLFRELLNRPNVA